VAWLTELPGLRESIGGALVYWKSNLLIQAIAVAAVFSFTAMAPGWGRRAFARWDRRLSRFAVRRKPAILAAAAAPLLARLALLPFIPIPEPITPDEFGHLLLADTFASGRLTNPMHPMWRYFETLYVFHQPTYTALYPIAQGLFMAIPMRLGVDPWFGVCLSMGLMCAALCWMLQAWLPAKWALYGAFLVGAQLAVASYWMNTYWGGAPAAIGGALVLGAAPRLLRQAGVPDALLAGLGAALLSQSRPFEGLLLTLPVGALLLCRLAVRARRNAPVLATLAAVAIAIAAATCYYNWRVTGSPWLLPYQWHQKIYGMPQNLLGSAPLRTAWRVDAQKDIFQNFQWQLGEFQAQSTWQGLLTAIPAKLFQFWQFYLGPLLTLPFFFLPLSREPIRIRLLALTGCFVLLAGFVLYPFFFAHYAAPLYGVLLVLLLQAVRRMRVFRWRGKPFGAALFRWWALGTVAYCLLLALGSVLAPDQVVEEDSPRARIERELRQRGGKHVVLVRYTESHNYHEPWIYNAADIDRSPVVWAREFDRAQLAPLLHYYAGRCVWLVNADDDTPELKAYSTAGTAAPP
jgi:hypothetical protein